MNEFREFVGNVGGVQIVANACGVEPKTVYKWWERGHVPPNKAFTLIRLAEKANVPLTMATVEEWASKQQANHAA